MLVKVEGSVLAEFEDGFLIYQPDRDRVHHLTRTAGLVFELCRRGIPPARIAGVLAEAYGLAQPPAEQVGRVVEYLLSEALAPTCREPESGQPSPEGCIGGEEKLLASVTSEGSSLVKRALAEKAYVAPAIESFPVDGLSVTSARCSARWANLDDNTCYTRRHPTTVEGKSDA